LNIIIDGNDGVGKTTLAKLLQKEFKIKSYIHLSAKDPRDFGFYYNILLKNDAIFDRSFMDEDIYSRVLERKCELSDTEQLILHHAVTATKAIVIICHTDSKGYDLGEDERILKHHRMIDDYFKNLADKYSYIYFDPHKDSYEALVNTIYIKESLL